MTYTYDEVRKASIAYFNGDELAAEVFAGKYALRDQKGQLYELTPADMHRRLAKEFARIEAKYPNPMTEDEIYELLASWKVVPQGSPMSGIGNPYQLQSLSNCFVIESPEDSYGGILRADQELIQIMKRRGGVGLDISNIRPKNMATSNAARTTDGIGVFMERYSNSCREVAQGGRRGALMITIDVHHPEIRTFVNIKRNLEKVTGANISIRLSNEFMEAVKNKTTVQLRFPVAKGVEHQTEESVDANDLWNEIIESAHSSAEPGLLFWDNVTKMSPADCYSDVGYQTKSTNPCGELPLSPYDSCRLVLVNADAFVVDRFSVSPEAHFDFVEFERVCYKAQRLMDDLVDLEIEAIDRILSKISNDPEPNYVRENEIALWTKIRKAAVGGRRSGLGITGLGDALAGMNITYGSDRSILAVGAIYRYLATAAYESSIDMAEERGAFPVFAAEKKENNPFLERILGEIGEEHYYKYEKYGRRNIALTTTAPAGSVSILTQTTSGCEPAYLLSYKRRRKITAADLEARVDFVDAKGDRWQEYTVYHHGFKKWMDATGLTETDVEKSPYWKATSADVDWVKKIDMQAEAQRWICHAISNTTNVPADTTVETVKEIYMRGWETGCKGVTIYRDGCRDGVLVSNDKPKQTDEQPASIIESHAPKRPKELPCDIHRTTVHGEPYLVIVGLHNGLPYEVFCGLQKYFEIPKKIKSGTLVKGAKVDGIAAYNLKIQLNDEDELVFKDIAFLFDNPVYGTLTRTLSLALRHGVPIGYLVEQLRKDKHSDVTSFSTVVARVLGKNYIVDGTKVTSEKKCGDCGGTNLQYVQGCVTCLDCGSSKCG